MTSTTFDALGYFERLKAAGVPEEQAKVQAEGMRAQAQAIQIAIREYDSARQKDGATKGDVHNVRLEVENVRPEIEKVRGEMKAMETRLLKWQLGIGFAIVVIMAKGFGWLGF